VAAMIKRISLAVVSVVMVLFSPILGSAQTETPSLRDQCRSLMVDPPPLSEPPESVEIVSPSDGQALNGGTVNVRVVAQNFDLTNGGHWHLWVDNSLAGMIYGDRAVIDLAPGTHRLCAFVGNEQHNDLGVPDGVVITVREASLGLSTTIPDPQATVLQADSVSSPLLIIVLGGAAAVGGILVGTRLGRRTKK